MADGSVIFDTSLNAKGFEKGLSSLAKGAAATAAGVTAALGGMATAAIGVGSNFEASMSQVAATMGLSVAEINAGSESFEILSTAAKEAGESTAFSASEAAEGLNYLALAGYDVATAAEVLPSVLNLAATGGMDLAYASDLATDAMAALGIEAGAENLTTFGDKMAKTASKANTSVAQLGEAILTVGGTAKVLAGGTTELNTVLGLLANEGTKGSETGTALRNVILSLTAPTDKAAAKIKELELNVADANGDLRPLNDIFKDLNASLAEMSSTDKTKALNEIFNKVDLKSVQTLLANCGEQFDNLSAAIDDSGGAMQQMADVQLDNLKGDLTILGSAAEGLGVAFYENIKGTAREAVQSFTNTLSSASFRQSFDELSSAAGGMIQTLGRLANDTLPVLIDAFTFLAANAGDAPVILKGELSYYVTGSLSDLYKTALLNVLRGQGIEGYTPHIALFNGNPQAGGGELSGDNYERVPLDMTAPVDAASGQMESSNAAAVSFNRPTSNWGIWSYTALYTAASGGKPVWIEQKASAKELKKDYMPRVAQGDLKVAVN